MMAYLYEVNAMSIKIKDFKIHQNFKEENKKANALANLTSTFDFISNRSVPLEFISNSSIDVAQIICQATTYPTWMNDIIAYLKDGKLPFKKISGMTDPVLVNQILPLPRDII